MSTITTPTAATGDPTKLIVKLDARPDFTAARALPRGADRKSAAYASLVDTARASQAPVVALAEQLKGAGIVTGYESLVSPNVLVVSTAAAKTQAALDAFLGAAGVQGIYSDVTGERVTRASELPGIAPGAPTWGLDVVGPAEEIATELVERPYGIDLVGAPEAWKQGATGAGLVFGSIDTGVDPTHEALTTKYRGQAADGSVSHDYNWFDPRGTQVPSDGHGHGTHTIGTVTGADVGVAPEAKFISASGLGAGVSGALKSLQWMLAPTRVDGSDADPTKAPDVVGMSWFMGSSSSDTFLESMQNLREAGIVPVKSAGNQGPKPKSITSPGQYPEVIATAAVDAKGEVARFSSRGPAPWPKGSTTPKPDFAAPGVDVVSTMPRGRYGKMSGTSMAQPHMSGAILAILSRYPDLTDEQLTAVLTAGAIDKGAAGFDPEYGAGLINLPASLEAAAKLVAG